MQKAHLPAVRRKFSSLKTASFAGIAVTAGVLVGVLLLLLFPDPIVNGFITPRVSKAVAEAYPAYSIHIGHVSWRIFQNRLVCDSVALSAVDGTFAGAMGPISVNGIDWIPLLWGRALDAGSFDNVDLDARDIEVHFLQSHYDFRCERLRASVPDSAIVLGPMTLSPSWDDEQFFAGSRFRTTRFRLVVPEARAMGVAWLTLLQGKNYRTRSAHICDAFLDILINKEKPCAADTSRPPMPGEILSSIPGDLQIDSLSIVNGRLEYGERFGVRSTPALITFDSMQVLAEGIANHRHRGAAMVIHTQGRFMKGGTMKVLMQIPVASPEFSFQYSGSLSRMDVRALNPFLETAEQMRITAGLLHGATFAITVTSGRASGTVRAVYRDLTLAVIDEHTRNSTGFSDRVASFIANSFTIRGTNVPDGSGAMTIGEVRYIRQPDDPFFRFVWFALRSGVGDVVGF